MATEIFYPHMPASGHGKPRLGLAVDDFEIETGLAPDAADEGLAVRGRTAGPGGDQPCPLDLAVRKLVSADLQRLDGAIHRRLT